MYQVVSKSYNSIPGIKLKNTFGRQNYPEANKEKYAMSSSQRESPGIQRAGKHIMSWGEKSSVESDTQMAQMK